MSVDHRSVADACAITGLVTVCIFYNIFFKKKLRQFDRYVLNCTYDTFYLCIFCYGTVRYGTGTVLYRRSFRVDKLSAIRIHIFMYVDYEKNIHQKSNK